MQLAPGPFGQAGGSYFFQPCQPCKIEIAAPGDMSGNASFDRAITVLAWVYPKETNHTIRLFQFRGARGLIIEFTPLGINVEFTATVHKSKAHRFNLNNALPKRRWHYIGK